MGAIANRNRYRRIANRVRRIPGEHGLRPWRVYLSTGAWSSSSGHPFGEGSRTDTDVEILESGQPPKVRELSDERVALGAGEKGDVEVGPITPVAGTAWAALLGDSTSQDESWRIKLVHDETGDTKHCLVKSVKQDQALRVTFTVSPVRTDA